MLQASTGKYDSIDADIRGNVYAYAAASGRQDFYDAIKSIYLSVSLLQ